MSDRDDPFHIQIAARELEVPIERIYITEHATDKIPNTSPTAASTGSDLNGMAVMVRWLLKLFSARGV